MILYIMLPKSLDYSRNNKVESSMARSYRSNISPMNGTGNYGCGDQIVINIPTRNNLVLATTESYLKFNVTFKNGSSASSMRWDSCGAHGIIQKISVFHGSNLLETIDNYGLLAKMMFDLQVSSDASYGKYNCTAGTRNDITFKLPDIVAGSSYAQADLAALDNVVLSCLQTNSGDGLGVLAASATTTTQTYCLNLISLVGTLCSQQYFPLYKCTSCPLRVEITLVDSVIKAVACASDPDTSSSAMVVNNVEYIGNFIELSDEAIEIIDNNLYGEKMQFVFPDYRNYSYQGLTIAASGTTTTATTQFSIGAKFSSLKSLFITCRDNGTGKTGAFPFSCISNGLQDYTFRVGSLIMPPKGPNSAAEQFCEVLKAIGSMSDLNHQPSIEKASYTQKSSLTYTVETSTSVSNINSGSCYVGLDLENYAGSDRSRLFSGFNSNNDDIFYNGNISFTPGSGAAAYNPRWDCFALFDSCIVFENNTAYVVF